MLFQENFLWSFLGIKYPEFGFSWQKNCSFFFLKFKEAAATKG